MNSEEIEKFVRVASRGDTSELENLLKRPGGRKFFETTILVIVNYLPLPEQDKKGYLKSFIEILDRMEERIKHQKRGEKILKQAFNG